MRNGGLVLFLILIFSGCKDSSTDPFIVGKWKLIAVAYSNDNGDNEFTPIESDKVIQFFEDNTLISNQSLCNGGDQPSTSESTGTYNSEEMFLIANCDDFGEIKRGFSFDGSEMGVFGVCGNEYCMEKYRKL